MIATKAYEYNRLKKHPFASHNNSNAKLFTEATVKQYYKNYILCICSSFNTNVIVVYCD